MLQLQNIHNWRMTAIKGCAVVSIPTVITEKGKRNDDFPNVGVTCN